MQSVSLPSVIPSFYRALDEVLRPYLSTGNPATLSGYWVNFYNCELLYGIEKLAESVTEVDGKVNPLQKPFICFAGSGAVQAVTEKCNDPRELREFGFEIRQPISRTVYVGISKSLMFNPPPYPTLTKVRKANSLDTDTIWSQLFLVMEHQLAALRERGIFRARIPSVPAPQPDKHYHLLRAEAEFEIHFKLTRGN